MLWRRHRTVLATSWKPDRIGFFLPGYVLLSPTAKMPGVEVWNVAVFVDRSPRRAEIWPRHGGGARLAPPSACTLAQ